MTGAAAKRRKLTRQSESDAQDSVEAELSEPQDAAAPQHHPNIVSINGNGNSLHHGTDSRDVSKKQFPAYPFFNADSARLYPEWSLPEPVAVPRAVNGALWDSPWLQQQDHHQAKPHQAITADQSENDGKFNAPTASASYQHETLPTPTAQSQPSGAAAGQRQHANQPEAASAQAESQPGCLQHSQHPSVSQVTLAQPDPFSAAAGERMAHPFTQPGQADPQSLLTQPQGLANSHLLHAATDSLQGQGLPPSSHQQLLSQQQQQAHLREQSHQQPHLPTPGGDLSHDTHLRHQQPGAGPSGTEQLPTSLKTGAAPSDTEQLPSGFSGGAGPSDTGQVPAGLSGGAGPLDTGQVPSGPNVGAYSQRELFLQNMEQAGDMSFEYVLNDGQRHNSIWLIALKNIFSKQLPNMPREYIARLVLDRRHRSVAIVRRKLNVVGGITYRPFHQQRFGEIAFCAVTANEQVKGFGTRLMNYTKEYAKTQDQLTHFLTYADNNAVGYFAKQGFTKEITLEQEWWVGYIKDYDGGTLMECVIVQRLPHTRLPHMLQAQKKALDSRIRQYSKSHIVHEGLTALQNSRRVDISSIPGVKEAGWDPGDPSGTGVKLLMNNSILDATPNNLQHFMLMVVHQVQQQEDAWPFLHAVSPEEVPDYHDIIKDPMDLGLMEQRLKQKDYYLTLDIFAADMRRIFSNARIYNASDSPYYKWANKLEVFFDQYMHAHLLFGQ